ncbi:MAG TPA: Pycsar system effector family protein [Acidimicrobiales bacterium]
MSAPVDETQPADCGPPALSREEFARVQEVAEKMVQEARQELAQAENKASLLLSASFVVVSVVISNASSGGAFSELDNPLVQILFWLGLASAVYGMGLLVLAILPRFRNIGDRNRLAFFAHAAAFGEGPTGGDDVAREQVRRELGRALVAVATVSSLDRLTDRVFDISTIVLAKYRRVRWAMLSLALGAVLLAGSSGLRALLQ